MNCQHLDLIRNKLSIVAVLDFLMMVITNLKMNYSIMTTAFTKFCRSKIVFPLLGLKCSLSATIIAARNSFIL